MSSDEEVHDTTEITRGTGDAGDEAYDVERLENESHASNQGNPDIPLLVGCTWGDSEKTLPLPASSKKANAVLRPIIAPIDLGSMKPMISIMTPIMIVRACMRIFLPHKEAVFRYIAEDVESALLRQNNKTR